MHYREKAFAAIAAACGKAWEKGLLAGFNGNVSLRHGEQCYITESGAAKGYLRAEQIAVVRIADGAPVGGMPSSELGMHLEIYRAMPQVQCIVHTHPRHMLALDLLVPWQEFLHVPLFEAENLRAQLGQVDALLPGTSDLAQAVAAQHRTHKAVWLARHGLCVVGAGLTDAVALSEELEHMAAVQLLTRA